MRLFLKWPATVWLRPLQRGWHGFDRNVCLDLIGAVAEAAIEVAGGESVRSRVVSGGRDGHDELELELRWTRR